MLNYLKEKRKLYPLEALLVSLFITIFGLLLVKNKNTIYFILGVWLLNFFFVSIKNSLKILIPLLIIGGSFTLISYYTNFKDIEIAKQTALRFLVIFIASIPSLSIEPIRLSRNLNKLKFPRKLTLGILIVFSFSPYLKKEIKRVRCAMKTRGIVNILNPFVFYRAFLIPFVTRLLDISDTLSLSIETRGFSNKEKHSIYKNIKFNLIDLIYLVLLTAISCVVFI